MLADVTERLLGILAIVLGGAAFAVGGQVIRDAWRGAFKRPRAKMPAPSGASGRPGAGADPAVRHARRRIHSKCRHS